MAGTLAGMPGRLGSAGLVDTLARPAGGGTVDLPVYIRTEGKIVSICRTSQVLRGRNDAYQH